jgi:hypothetical protein
VQRRLPRTAAAATAAAAAAAARTADGSWRDHEFKLLNVPDKTTDPSKFINDDDK